MTLQLFYPLSQREQWIDDARIARGISTMPILPDGTRCYSIQTSDEMAKNLVIMPCTDWKELVNKPRHQDCILDAARYFGVFANCRIKQIHLPTIPVSPDTFKYPVTENPPLM